MKFWQDTNTILSTKLVGLLVMALGIFWGSSTVAAKGIPTGWYYTTDSLKIIKNRQSTAHRLQPDTLMAVHWQTHSVKVISPEVTITCQTKTTETQNKTLITLDCDGTRRYAFWQQTSRRKIETNLISAILGRNSKAHLKLQSGPDLIDVIHKWDTQQRQEILTRFNGDYQMNAVSLHLSPEGIWSEELDRTNIATTSCFLKISHKTEPTPAFCFTVNHRSRSQAYVFWEDASGQKLRSISLNESQEPWRPIATLQNTGDFSRQSF